MENQCKKLILVRKNGVKFRILEMRKKHYYWRKNSKFENLREKKLKTTTPQKIENKKNDAVGIETGTEQYFNNCYLRLPLSVNHTTLVSCPTTLRKTFLLNRDFKIFKFRTNLEAVEYRYWKCDYQQKHWSNGGNDFDQFWTFRSCKNKIK